MRHDQGRAAIAFDHAGRGDADHPAMPTFAVDHDAVRIAEAWLLLKTLFNRLQDSLLCFLPLAVELVETQRDLTRPVLIFHAEELNYVACDIHPTSRIQARCNPERDLDGRRG